MSLIHDALQNVDSYLNEDADAQGERVQERNDLYKVNRFDLSLMNVITFLITISGVLAVCYLLYQQMFGGASVPSLPSDYVEEVVVEDDIQEEVVIDPNSTFASDFDANSVVEEDFIEEEVVENTDKQVVETQSAFASLDRSPIINRNTALDEGVDDESLAQADVSIIKQFSAINKNLDNDIDAINGGIFGGKDLSEQTGEMFADKPPAGLDTAAIPTLDNSAVTSITLEENPSNQTYQEVPAAITISARKVEKSEYFKLQSEAYDLMVSEDFSAARDRLKTILLSDGNDYSANLNMVLIDIQQQSYKSAYRRLLTLKQSYPFKKRVDELISLVEGFNNESL